MSAWSNLAVLAIASGLTLVLLRWSATWLRPNPAAPSVRVLGRYSPVLTWLRYRAPGWRPAWPFPPLASTLALLLREIWSNEAQAMKLMATLACLAINLWVGYTYALTIMVNGWQLWTWLASVCFALVLLLPATWPPVKLGRHAVALGGLCLVALALRALWLETIPGGLHIDEAGVADFALRHVYFEPNQIVNPFRTGPEAHPALYHILMRLSMAVGGISITGLRLSSAIAGALAVLATYAVVAVFHNRPTAWWAAVLTATYHYHVHWSRIGLNNIWDTVWVPVMLAAFAWGWKHQWSGGAVLSGLVLGLSQYFYPGSRIGAMLLVLYAARLLMGRPDRRQWLMYVGKMILMAVIVAVPLLVFAARDPQPFISRSWVVFGWKPEVVQQVLGPAGTYWDYFWYQLVHAAGAFTVFPDVTGFYGPGLPLLFGAAAVLFVVGLAWAVRLRQYLPLAWITLTVIFGGFMLTGNPSSSHYVVSIPAICWLVALPLGWLMQHGRWREAVAIGALIMVSDLGFYFGVYVPSEPQDLRMPFPVWPPE